MVNKWHLILWPFKLATTPQKWTKGWSNQPAMLGGINKIHVSYRSVILVGHLRLICHRFIIDVVDKSWYLLWAKFFCADINLNKKKKDYVPCIPLWHQMGINLKCASKHKADKLKFLSQNHLFQAFGNWV